ncbi:hypothetical protein JCM9279_003053 [Rhodotorula babjevae]
MSALMTTTTSTSTLAVHILRVDQAFPAPSSDGALNDRSLDPLLDLLDPDSRADVHKFRFLRDARRCLCGRLLARYAASTRLSKPWPTLSFQKSERGRPYLEPSEQSTWTYDYNTSHDGELVVVASHGPSPSASPHGPPSSTMSSPRVGVDVMRIKNPWDGTSTDEFISGVAEQLAPRELSALSRLSWGPGSDARRLRHLLALWTLKEAFVKATGEGLHRDLRTIAFDIELDGDNAEGGEVRRIGEGRLDGSRLDGWRFSLVEVDEGGAGASQEQERQKYWLAVAEETAGEGGEVRLALRPPRWLHEVALEQVEALARDEAL